jgi:hypothetical protein
VTNAGPEARRPIFDAGMRGGGGGDGADRKDGIGVLGLGHGDATAGGPGGGGGDAGQGGPGGNGGNGGSITVLTVFPPLFPLEASVDGGSVGEGGDGGDGGDGGLGGLGGQYWWTETKVVGVGRHADTITETRYDRKPSGGQGPRGAGGAVGVSGPSGASPGVVVTRSGRPHEALAPYARLSQRRMVLELASTLYLSTDPADLLDSTTSSESARKAARLFAWLQGVLRPYSELVELLEVDGLEPKELEALREQLLSVAEAEREELGLIHRHADGLAGQLRTGLDYFGLEADFVPRGSVHLYRSTLAELVPRFRRVEAVRQRYADETQSAEQKRAQLHLALTEAESHRAYLTAKK